jgi:hypothetical protein
MIRIKDDFFKQEEIVGLAFDKAEGQVAVFFKNGTAFMYGKARRPGTVPQQRVITDAEYEKLKDHFSITLQAKVII